MQTSRRIANQKNAVSRGVSKLPQEKFVLTEVFEKESMQDKVNSVLDLYYNGTYPREIIQIIIEYAGLLFRGKKSLCWIQYY